MHRKKSSLILLGSTILTLIFAGFSLIGNKKIDTAAYGWSAANNLGPHINSGSKDEHATFTPDGHTMVFASTREGGFGAYDLYASHLENGEWTKAELLPFPINTHKDDFDPFITPEGKKLIFASNRDNSDKYWDCDIYVASWSGKKWTDPELYDPVFVTPDKPDWGATITRDFETFIFSSGRNLDKPHSVQIFQSFWLRNKWSVPELLPFPVNAGKWEATPYITPDGKTLYLNSIRGGPDKKDVDIWRFEFKEGKWTNPRLMDGPFLSDKQDYDPCLSPDGKKFYFTSDRNGGLGDADIYVVSCSRKGDPS
jgi:Tol biopolymer transport system component